MINRDCVKKYASRSGYSFTEIKNYLVMESSTDGTKKELWYFFDNGQWVLVESEGIKAKSVDSGTWECDGGENFKIFAANYTFMSDSEAWVESETNNTDDSVVFACILKNKGTAANLDSNGESVWFWVDEPNKVAHIFYKKDNKWVQSKDGTEQFMGRWNCDEDNHFLIVSNDGQSYSSRSDNWEKVTTVGNLNDSFPLKFGSEGPNVVKLQKFLNDRIRTNPLTVNGIFDQKTQDKLIEFQKKEGIIE